MDLLTMRRLIETEVAQGSAIAQNDLAFVDWRVPDRMLYSPVVSRNLTQPLAHHLACAERGSYAVWTLQDIITTSTAEELMDAEAFAREHYGPAPPPGVDAARPVRRQRRGCRGGKGRKRHVMDEFGNPLGSPRGGAFSPRIMSGHDAGPSGPYMPPIPPPGTWPVRAMQPMVPGVGWRGLHFAPAPPRL